MIISKTTSCSSLFNTSIECFGLDKIHYAYQEGEGGIADALSKAESFVGKEED